MQIHYVVNSYYYSKLQYELSTHSMYIISNYIQDTFTRALSSIFEGLVMIAKILLSTCFERKTFGANHITLMIIYIMKDKFGDFKVWRNLKMARRTAMPAELERTLLYG